MIARFYRNWIAQDVDNHSLKFILGMLSALIIGYHKIVIEGVENVQNNKK
jgi:hypothetical protein